MKQFLMKQRVSGKKDTIIIKDRRGEETYTVASTELEDDVLLMISNLKKEPVVLVKQEKKGNQSKFVVQSNNQDIFLIETDEDRLLMTASSEDLTISGDLLAMKFDVMYGYRKVGKVRKRWISSEDAYELTVFETDREKALVGLLAVLDFTMNLSNVA